MDINLVETEFVLNIKLIVCITVIQLHDDYISVHYFVDFDESSKIVS